jgi:hypothetical protein
MKKDDGVTDAEVVDEEPPAWTPPAAEPEPPAEGTAPTEPEPPAGEKKDA